MATPAIDYFAIPATTSSTYRPGRTILKTRDELLCSIDNIITGACASIMCKVCLDVCVCKSVKQIVLRIQTEVSKIPSFSYIPSINYQIYQKS